MPVTSLPPDPGSSPLAIGTQQLAWTRLDTPDRRPQAREDHTLTVDADGHGAWLFGGRTAGGRVLGDLWRLDLATDRWQRVPRGAGAPRGRFGHSSVWVPDVGLVIWAGQSARGFLDDLWAYHPDTARWQRLADPDERHPRARYGSCMALGPDGRIWISHGFTDDLGRFDDTWAFDLAAGRWQEQTPDGRPPGARCLHECTWTPDGRFVLYGGQTTGVPALGDLWTMGIGGAWQRVGQGERPRLVPAARSLPALARMAGDAWLFGGADLDREALADLWRLDLASMSWQPIEVDEDGPRARYGATLIGDAARGRLLLFAGRDGTRAYADLWALHAAPPTPSASPSPSGTGTTTASPDRP
jgi:hypothetical protein